MKKTVFHTKTVYQILFLSLIFIFGIANSCDDEEAQVSNVNKEETDAEEEKKIYIPDEFDGEDFNDENSTWCYKRSRESDNFIVFWGKGYGDKDPGASEVPEAYRVDIDDMLEKAEGFYDLNVNQLKFAEVGVGKSLLDDYKMMIFLFYQDEWNATGAGYDDTIGALWLSPNTCQPVGSTIAHEIGHSFQYQVFCDRGGTSGYRYGFGGNGGNAFWEQCAQWQAYQSYPEEVFGSGHFSVYCDNAHRHLHHEDYRYASYFIHYYWAQKHGIDIIGRLWRLAEEPEDPIQTYMRITNISVEQFNDEIYDAASRFVTWDIDALREMGVAYVGKQSFKFVELGDGSYQVAYDRCPGTTGYNAIPLNVPEAGTTISAEFTGLVNALGFNQVENPERAGWRYGYVALLDDGSRVYGDMMSGTENVVNFVVSEKCKKLWFVVTGAPDTYVPHAWDDDESNDDQWPYKVKFTNTDILGNIHFDGTEIHESVVFNFDINFPFSNSEYSGTTITLEGSNLIDLCKGFVLKPGEITSKIGSDIGFNGREADGTLNANTTANGYGHWFDAEGNVCGWGSEARLFSEFNASAFSFSIGQYPGQCVPGEQYSISQALVYEYESGKTVQATFIFNVIID
ncbi:DUF4859 domain-containing protein [Geofilum sp. OHC36d9]|uniref:DUF4859 domain-containing protein n=1 Tax=Geofilum sp. OHC36d9 TaxID=3458413 RepID=UPI004033F748